MGVGSALMRGVRTLGRRDFWTFKVTHAVLGGALTVTGACGGIFVTEQSGAARVMWHELCYPEEPERTSMHGLRQ